MEGGRSKYFEVVEDAFSLAKCSGGASKVMRHIDQRRRGPERERGFHMVFLFSFTFETLS